MSTDMTPEIARLDQKIESFILSQQETNAHLTRSIEKISEAITQQQTQQVEINQITAQQLRLESKIDDLSKAVVSLEKNQAVAEDFKGQVTWLIRLCIGAMIAGIFGLFWWLVKGA